MNSGVYRRSTQRQSSIGKMKSGGKTGSWRIIFGSPCGTDGCGPMPGAGPALNGATGDLPSSVLLCIHHLPQVLNDGVCAVPEQGLGVAFAIDPEHQTEPARPARLDARDGVLHDDG